MSKEYREALKTVGLSALLLIFLLGADPVLMWVVGTAASTGNWSFWAVYALWGFVAALVITGLLLRHLLKDRPEQRAR